MAETEGGRPGDGGTGDGGEPAPEHPDRRARRGDDRRRTIDLTYLERGGPERRSVPGVDRRTAAGADVPPSERDDDPDEDAGAES